MSPTPEEPIVAEDSVNDPLSKPLTGNEVVISGISGIYPQSDSVKKFSENLFNKVDMMRPTTRWDLPTHPEISKTVGFVEGIEKFDAQFFRVNYKQAWTMEPMSRVLLEHAYSAIFDSGINPLQLRGKKVGVFVGATFSESEKFLIYENVQRNGLGITGCNKAMYANRISYWIDGKGPSYCLDVACSSSMACIEHAYRYIRSGVIDAALVGGCNLCMHPVVNLNMRRAGFLTMSEKTRCFDKHGDGYSRSDAIGILFLQRAKDAKRIYSEVYHAKGHYSSAPNDDFLPIRTSKDIQDFLNAFYSEIDVSPSEVEYIEANATAIPEADAEELDAIGKVFAKDRTVKVGSVKSNMGNSEPASGLSSATKICLSYHKGALPANLYYKDPLDHIDSVRDGRLDILQDNANFKRGFSAMNSFSYSGVNVHVLLKGQYKAKDELRYQNGMPRLVLASGRQDNCVQHIIDNLKNEPLDTEQIALLQNIFVVDIPGHLSRGFTILDKNEKNQTISLKESIEYCSGTTRPIWFVYSGMGSQWAGMGANLMQIPIFASAIQRCHKVLEPKGIDLIRVLTDPDKKIYDNILNSFIGIAAVQIGLTDCLKAMEIVPDNIIGHSVGELGCAYADGCFTAEEMILSAYSRGLVSIQTPFIRGSMAAVGLGYKDVLPLCPPEIEVACHNSSESSTISGPEEILREFVTELTNKGIFAKEVACSNIPYHSRYIAEAGPGLLKYLSEVIKDPKPRSKKWVSTSVPQEKWDDPSAQFSSAEYHTNNLLNSVLFEETAKLIPENAMLIEVAPHGLLQAILKRSHSGCINIPLTRRGNAYPVQFFLESIGKIYQDGCNPKISALYPQVEFPVSTETAMLSHLVKWEHSEDWPIAVYNSRDRRTTTIRKFITSIYDDDFSFLQNHVRNGVMIFPEACYLKMIWETLAMHSNENYRDISVSFHNVIFHGEAQLKPEEPFRLAVMINRGNNKFEITHEDKAFVTGEVYAERVIKPYRKLSDEETEDNDFILKTDDIYTLLRDKGFHYSGQFNSIISTNSSVSKGKVKWTDDWAILIDSMIQFNMLVNAEKNIAGPKSIKKLTISTEFFKNYINTSDGDNYVLDIQHSKIFNITRCGGIELDQIVFADKVIVAKNPDVIADGNFIPHSISGDISIKSAISINLQVIAENLIEDNIKIVEIVTDNLSIADVVTEVADSIPNADFQILSIQAKNVSFDDTNTITNSNVFIVTSLLEDSKKIENMELMLSKNQYVITIEENLKKPQVKLNKLIVITSFTVRSKNVILLKKNEDYELATYMKIVQDQQFEWVPKIKHELEKNKCVVLISERQSYVGILGMLKKINQLYANKVSVVIIDDYQAPSFDPECEFYKKQLNKNLTVNILKKQRWGGYYYLPGSTEANVENVRLVSTKSGDIDSLTWIEADSLKTSNHLVKVFYAGTSYRDGQKAVGNIANDGVAYGVDFSGVDGKGQKVMGVLSGGTISKMVEADPDLLWPIPDHWTLEDAATVPWPYIHAYYLLATYHGLMPKQRVFVHGGAGALGQAVISLCLALDCEVFTTVNDTNKKRFLCKLFPKLKEGNIGSSQDDTFYQMVITNSENGRCDHVINCLSGYKRLAATKCVAFSGKFYDISDYDMKEHNDFGMSYLREERNYGAAQVSNIFLPESGETRKIIQILISNGIAKGIVRPISRVVYTPNTISRAFRLLSASRHIGRVLIKMTEPINANQGTRAEPRVSYSPEGSYVVVCDKTGLGFDLIDHMVKRGARNIVIHNNEDIDGNLYFRIRSWMKHQPNIQVSSENLGTEKGCSNLLKKADNLGKVFGIFIVQESVLRNDMTSKDFVSSFNETSLVVANLDLTSREICKDLRHFVVFTKKSKSLVQEYMTSVSKRICQVRSEVGLPALAFDVINLDEDNERTRKIKPLKWSTVVEALDTSLRLKYTDVITYDLLKKENKTLDKIATLLGFKNIDDIPESCTMQEFRLDDYLVDEIKRILVIEKNVRINVNCDTMTIADLKALCRKIPPPRTIDGLGAFYTFIDKDECTATEPVMPMATLLSNNTEQEEEHDSKDNFLMMIPGFEGHNQIFVPISESLKIKAQTIQLRPDLKDDSISEMAADILSYMRRRFVIKPNFHFLGYSFGVNVALELAALMEKEGCVGTVFCLDSSPEALKVQLDAALGDLSDTQLQDAIVLHIYQLMTGVESEQLKADLVKLENWPDKVEACVIGLRGRANYSNQYKRSLLQGAFKRMKLAKSYEPNFKLESQIVLMKGIPHPKGKKLDEDYGLSKYSVKPVKVFDIESYNAETPYNCRVSNIVNRLLDPAILDAFKSKSLCESYLADPIKVF